MRRVVGGMVLAAGAAVLAFAAGMAWLSWMEPHSQGIHPADRGPLAALAVGGLALSGIGWTVLRRPR